MTAANHRMADERTLVVRSYTRLAYNSSVAASNVGERYYRRIALLAPVALVVVLGWQRRWMSDDGYINLRVVQEVFAGHGLVFNPGERVEVATSSLWLAVLVIGHAIVPPLPLPWLAVALGIAATAGAVLIAQLGARRWFATAGMDATVPFGVLVVIAIPPVWDFATSGLEVGIVFLWLATCYWALARRLGAGVQLVSRPRWLLVLLGIGPLVRPDLVVFSVVFIVVLVAMSRRTWRALVMAIVWATLVPLAYQLFRMGYYGALVPNAALYKEAGQSDVRRGLRYALDFTATYAVVVPLALGAALAWIIWHNRRDRAGPLPHAALLVAAAPLVGAALHGSYVVWVGGDFMRARLLLPAFFAAMLPVAAIPIPHAFAHVPRWLPATLLVLAALWAVGAATIARHPISRLQSQVVTDERAFDVTYTGSAHPVTTDDWSKTDSVVAARHARVLRDERRDVLIFDDGDEVAASEGRGPLLVFGTVGVVAYAAGPDIPVIDRFGLADPFGARLELTRRGRPGHEKKLPRAWILRDSPRIETLPT